MQRSEVSFVCDSRSSYVYICILRPKWPARISTDEEFLKRITSKSVSFSHFASTAVLKSRNSNQVAVFSIWKKDTLDLAESLKKRGNCRFSRKIKSRMRASLVKRSLRTIHSEVPPSLANMYEFEKALAKVSHVVHASWYEVSCGDYKDFTDPTVSSSATSVHDNVGRLSVKSSMYEPRALLRSASFHNVTGDGLTSSMPCSTPSPMHGDAEQTPFSSPCLSLASSCPSPSSSHSTESILRVHMSLGSIVHLRNVVGGRKEDRIQDMLSYSCLAILKAYFTQTEGLLSYTFYRSLDGSRMTGLGVWQNAFAAATFLNAPDGAPEEKYWRSIGAGTRFQIYEVVSLIA